jgi:hypothetical protein
MADVKDLVIGATTVGANYLKHVIATSDAGRTLIVSVSKTNITDAELNSVINFMTISKGANGLGDSAFTVAGVGTADGSPFVSGTTDVVYLRLQGTGALTAGADFAGVTGATVAIVCVFQPAK